jgi:hypothetical protein
VSQIKKLAKIIKALEEVNLTSKVSVAWCRRVVEQNENN